MTDFETIFLVWRKGSGSRRHAVGQLTRTAEGRHFFRYLPEAQELTKTEGFVPYTEFRDLNKEYNGNVVDIFAQRLTKPDRPDISNFYHFWEVDEAKSHDRFYLLGKTQGLVATDNFEFLAQYSMHKGIHFLTELAGLSKTLLPKGILQSEDELRVEREPDNPNDKYAVKVFKGEQFLGYIKKYHSRVFYDEGAEKLKVHVKALDQNGVVKRAFIRVSG